MIGSSLRLQCGGDYELFDDLYTHLQNQLANAEILSDLRYLPRNIANWVDITTAFAYSID
jgi:hypothetical protein